MKKILSIIAVAALVGGVREYIKYNRANADTKDTKEAAEKRLEQRYYKLDKTSPKWLTGRADEGDARAQFYLGLRCSETGSLDYHVKEGIITKKEAAWRRARGNNVAWAWFDIAQANGFPLAKNDKILLENKMTPAQIARAEDLVKEMVKKNPKLLKKYSEAQELSEEMLNAKKNPKLLKKK